MRPKNTSKPRRVVLLTFEQMNLLDLSGPLQALASANRLYAGQGRRLYDTCVASVHGGLITTSSGLPIMTVAIATLDEHDPDVGWNALPDADRVIRLRCPCVIVAVAPIPAIMHCIMT